MSWFCFESPLFGNLALSSSRRRLRDVGLQNGKRGEKVRMSSLEFDERGLSNLEVGLEEGVGR